MLVADDDDDVLEHEAEEQARSFLISDDPPERDALEGEPEGGDDDEQFHILPLVLQLLEAHAAAGGSERLDVHMGAIRARLRSAETFLAELEQKALSEDSNDERKLTQLLARRTDLLHEHTRRRQAKREREEREQ